MSAKYFVDTNLLVYARDGSEKQKQPRAENWMRHLWKSRSGRVSFQVLQEYYVTVTKKLVPGLPSDVARSDVRSLLAWSPVPADGRLVEAAWSLQDRYSLSWWDSLIVAAASSASCQTILTEDLQDGCDYDGIVAANPFRLAPPA